MAFFNIDEWISPFKTSEAATWSIFVVALLCGIVLGISSFYLYEQRGMSNIIRSKGRNLIPWQHSGRQKFETDVQHLFIVEDKGRRFLFWMIIAQLVVVILGAVLLWKFWSTDVVTAIDHASYQIALMGFQRIQRAFEELTSRAKGLEMAVAFDL